MLLQRRFLTMAAHEKYRQHLQEILHRHILKTTLYVSLENWFLLQVKLLILPEKRRSCFRNSVCCFEDICEGGKKLF